MNPSFARLRPDMTTDEEISYLRYQSPYVESIYYGYVLDEKQRLLGVVSCRELFSAERSRLVREIMHTDLVAASPEMDQEAVSLLFAKSRLLAIPVLDAEGRMEGIVTADDIADVIEQEASEDIQKLGGTEALDGPYLRVGFLEWFVNEPAGSRCSLSAKCSRLPR
jgi:magnesium transporter